MDKHEKEDLETLEVSKDKKPLLNKLSELSHSDLVFLVNMTKEKIDDYKYLDKAPHLRFHLGGGLKIVNVGNFSTREEFSGLVLNICGTSEHPNFAGIMKMFDSLLAKK